MEKTCNIVLWYFWKDLPKKEKIFYNYFLELCIYQPEYLCQNYFWCGQSSGRVHCGIGRLMVSWKNEKGKKSPHFKTTVFTIKGPTFILLFNILNSSTSTLILLHPCYISLTESPFTGLLTFQLKSRFFNGYIFTNIKTYEKLTPQLPSLLHHLQLSSIYFYIIQHLQNPK